MSADVGHIARPATFEMAMFLPPQELHPNARVHWAKKASAAKAYRLTVKASVYQHYRRDLGNVVPLFERAVLSLTYVFRTVRVRDDDNLVAWWKAGRDGLIDAGLLRGDGPDHVTIGDVTSRVEKSKPARVLVRLEAQEPPMAP